VKVKNQPVGTVECDRKGCSETCKVYRFRPRTEGRRTVFTDKYYFECPKHGRIGADGNPTVTEYVLCNAKMESAAPTGGSQKNPAPARTPAPTPASGSSSGGGNADAGNQPARTAARKSAWRTLIDLD